MNKIIVNDRRGINGKERKSRPFPDQITAEAKRYIIIKQVAEGKTYSEIVDNCVAAWGLGFKTVQNIVNEAIKYMTSDVAKESLIAINTQRLDSIISESMSDKDRKNAIKAIDVQNKMSGAYTEKIKLEGDDDINLVFNF